MASGWRTGGRVEAGWRPGGGAVAGWKKGPRSRSGGRGLTGGGQGGARPGKGATGDDWRAERWLEEQVEAEREELWVAVGGELSDWWEWERKPRRSRRERPAGAGVCSRQGPGRDAGKGCRGQTDRSDRPVSPGRRRVDGQHAGGERRWWALGDATGFTAGGGGRRAAWAATGASKGLRPFK
ncbi:uncharacterized protein LOC131859053 [Cryptomeria japonica]|uniref:uncharacterized protein LOC131859053 n=1 Tax=Cryptomeria japonica TaxID=3369 RepID=UPI0027DA2735|nr:uncharacterized protein LOC131859053 [Cryptomeria japonica]